MKVLLKDFVCRIKDIVDKNNTDLQYYVGGEHFESGEYRIHSKGLIKGSTIGPAFHMRFLPGDVLLMSRNPHLRKAAMVDFPGICSDVSYVCRTKDAGRLLQDFIPILFQTDQFWAFATENKKGSTNFFLNWSDFEKYEFNLPTIDEQRKLADLFWSAYDLRESYKRLFAASDEMAKSRFVEMFGDPITNTKEWSQKALKQVLRSGEKVTYGIVQTGDNVPGGIPVFRPVDIANGHIPKRIELKCTTEEISNRYKRTLLDGSELLITIRGSVGEVFLVNTDFAGCNVARNIVPLRLDERIVSRTFMKAFFQQPSTVQYIKSITKGIALQGVNICEFREMAIILPPLTLQRQFVLFLEQLDKSKVALQKSIERLDILIKTLLQEHLV